MAIATDCKSVAFGLRRFESSRSHDSLARFLIYQYQTLKFDDMIIYTVVIQSIKYDGSHQNSVENFKSLDAAKAFIDHCIESQKTLEGADSFMTFDLTGSMYEYGWVFSGKIPYGIETETLKKDKRFDVYKTKRFVIPTIVAE